MPPKRKEMSKGEMKKVEKFVEDKTFGLKNKSGLFGFLFSRT